MSNNIFFGKKQLVIIGLMVFSLILVTGSIVWAKSEMPKVLYFGTQDVGTSLYAISITISEKISPELGMRSRLIPGTDVDRINMMRQGKIQIAMLPADCYWSSMGLANSVYFCFRTATCKNRMGWDAGLCGFERDCNSNIRHKNTL